MLPSVPAGDNLSAKRSTPTLTRAFAFDESKRRRVTNQIDRRGKERIEKYDEKKVDIKNTKKKKKKKKKLRPLMLAKWRPRYTLKSIDRVWQFLARHRPLLSGLTNLTL